MNDDDRFRAPRPPGVGLLEGLVDRRTDALIARGDGRGHRKAREGIDPTLGRIGSAPGESGQVAVVYDAAYALSARLTEVPAKSATTSRRSRSIR